MKQLSGMDNVFLALESKNQYMHVASLSIYNPSTAPGGKVRFKTVLDYFTSRLGVSKVFRRRLVKPPFFMDRPYWIEDASIDVEYHVRHIGLPHPGDWRQLMIQIARIHARPLDLSKPLWEAYIIEGLDNIPGIAKGSFALYTKMHHSAIDGEMGAELAAAIHTLEPEFELSQDAMGHSSKNRGEAEPGLWELAGKAVNHRTKQIVDGSKLALTVSKRAVNLGREYGPAVKEMGEGYLNRVLGRTKASQDSEKRSSKIPRTRFQNKVSPHRVVDAVGLPLAEFKTIREGVEGVTINDIFLTLVGGGMKRYLESKGETPESSLSASIPISARKAKGQDVGNQVGMTVTSLHSDIEDPVERLKAVAEGAQGAKKVSDNLGVDLPMQLMNVVPSAIFESVLPYAMKNTCNVLVSNVRGPNVPLYFAGAQLQVYMPVSIPVNGGGLNVTGFSCNGVMWISVTCCRTMMPDPAFFMQCLKDDFESLVEASKVSENVA